MTTRETRDKTLTTFGEIDYLVGALRIDLVHPDHGLADGHLDELQRCIARLQALMITSEALSVA